MTDYSNQTTLQIAGESDLADLCALCDEVGLGKVPNQPSLDLAGIMALPTGRAWIARKDGVAVGCIAALFEGRRGWIYYFGVKAEARKTELAPQLLQTAEEYLKSLKAPKVLLMVRNSVPALHKYYARLGYGRDDVTVMGKWLLPVE